MVAAREASCLNCIVGCPEFKALAFAARKLQKLVKTSRLQQLHYSAGFAHLDQAIAHFRNAPGAFAMSGAPYQQSLEAHGNFHQCVPEPTAPMSDGLLLGMESAVMGPHHARENGYCSFGGDSSGGAPSLNAETISPLSSASRVASLDAAIIAVQSKGMLLRSDDVSDWDVGMLAFPVPNAATAFTQHC